MDEPPPVLRSNWCQFCGWASSYESGQLSQLLGVCQERALEVLEPSGHDVLVDVGCGSGAAVRRAAGTGAVTVGIDACPRMIERARQLGAGLPGAAYVLASADRLPFADGVFSALLCTSVLRHVGDRTAAAREMARVLVPGGRVVVGDFVRTLPCGGRRARRLAREAAAAVLPCTDFAIGSHIVCSTFLGPFLITQATRAGGIQRSGAKQPLFHLSRIGGP